MSNPGLPFLLASALCSAAVVVLVVIGETGAVSLALVLAGTALGYIGITRMKKAGVPNRVPKRENRP